ncbi:MAG TPA: Hpt domain-containing protein [Casimicrobiaceae bacterium]|jgi:HPt (histidine-containing phosphotransfer) domain-containing protein
MPAPAIDRATFDELKETAGADFVVELVDTFLVEAPAMLADLRRAFVARDAEVFRRTAHSLKSNGNTFGARTFAAMAKELELGGLAPVVSATGAPLAGLDDEYARVAAALQELKRA